MQTSREYDDIVRIKESVEDDLLRQSGVTGVDVGYKYINGQKTNRLAIRVFVAEKKHVSPVELIPGAIQGVDTDVIQRRFIPTGALPDVDSYDPLVGGISLGVCRLPDDTGTMGVLVVDNLTDDPMLLSCFHVMCGNSGWTVGDPLVQPSQGDGGTCPKDVVATLEKNTLSAWTGTKLIADCAVATVTARGVLCSIVDIGNVSGTATAAIDMPVRKRGRTSGLTFGIVENDSLAVNIDYGGTLGVQTFKNQISIEVDSSRSVAFQLPGDSGAVAVDDNNAVIGLIYGADDGDGTHGVASPIQSVLETLDVSICS